ncbi:hypothetical protein QN277_014848 [Acacia crassicarpa]|uniref:Photosystem II 22 kDa protein, chloroplastic n=1 Tax=Acacia crassicarpa TaxID=499986 RepID=A0AAE1JZA1_9FABA|nr:hypothetical protein QN277_014848 [Acacia crassicarpa]
MAQTLLPMSSVGTNYSADLKRNSSLQVQRQRLRPQFSDILFNPTSSISFSSSPSTLKTFALFKSKTKAPSKAVKPTPKPKVEDGIFGTSGGFGFTKENELFVGRVAMIGFAASLLGEAITGKGAIGGLGDRGKFVDDPPTGIEGAVIPPGKGLRSSLGLKEGGRLFGFTKANELFVGRLAQLGFVFSLIGEIITGKGALAQLNIETGVPINEIEPLVLFNVLFFFVAALNPGTGKFVTDEDDE